MKFSSHSLASGGLVCAPNNVPGLNFSSTALYTHIVTTKKISSDIEYPLAGQDLLYPKLLFSFSCFLLFKNNDLIGFMRLEAQNSIPGSVGHNLMMIGVELNVIDLNPKLTSSYSISPHLFMGILQNS